MLILCNLPSNFYEYVIYCVYLFYVICELFLATELQTLMAALMYLYVRLGAEAFAHSPYAYVLSTHAAQLGRHERPVRE